MTDLSSRIVCEPAECWAGCADPECHYTHLDTWRLPDGSSHFTRRDAEAAILRARQAADTEGAK